MQRLWILAVAAFVMCSIVPVPPARADTPEQIETQVMDALEKAMQSAQQHAAASLAQGDTSGALAVLDDAISRVDNLLAALDLQESRDALGKLWRAVLRKTKGYRNKLAKARKKMASSKATPIQVEKAVGKGLRAGLKIVSLMHRKLPVPGVAVIEKRARSAGFHPGNTSAFFKVFRGYDPRVGTDVPCTETITVNPIATPPDAFGGIINTLDGFLVTLGPARGIVSVNVTSCGETRTWLLYSRGNFHELKNLSKGGGGKAVVTGTWQGRYDTTAPALCAGFSGAWTANFQVDAAGNVTGNWNGDGFSGPISGRLKGKNIDFTVRGSGDVSLKGKVTGNTVNGSFTGEECTPASGNIKGTFSGARTQ